MTRPVDVAVIGAGIAGAAAAWHVTRLGGTATVIERETSPGMHATGRSAAVLSETSGHPAVCALAAQSRAFFEHPPEGFSDVPLHHPRGLLWVGRDGDGDALDELLRVGQAQRPSVRRVDPEQCRELLPALHPAAITGGGVHEPDAVALDVEACLRGFLRAAGTVLTGGTALALRHVATGWELDLDSGPLRCRAVVNAAGAWGDDVATMAGVAPLGLRPLRRTAAIVPLPAGVDARSWPLVMDADGRGYVEPDPGGLLVSPADETPSEPCDAQPDELDVALALEAAQALLDLPLRSVRHSWAGLRTFTADRVPAVGEDPDVAGFVWLVGQGGGGIKTAPALGELAARAALGLEAPAWDLDLEPLSPARFR